MERTPCRNRLIFQIISFLILLIMNSIIRIDIYQADSGRTPQKNIAFTFYIIRADFSIHLDLIYLPSQNHCIPAGVTWAKQLPASQDNRGSISMGCCRLPPALHCSPPFSSAIKHTLLPHDFPRASSDQPGLPHSRIHLGCSKFKRYFPFWIHNSVAKTCQAVSFSL